MVCGDAFVTLRCITLQYSTPRRGVCGGGAYVTLYCVTLHYDTVRLAGTCVTATLTLRYVTLHCIAFHYASPERVWRRRFGCITSRYITPRRDVYGGDAYVALHRIPLRLAGTCVAATFRLHHITLHDASPGRV